MYVEINTPTSAVANEDMNALIHIPSGIEIYTVSLDSGDVELKQSDEFKIFKKALSALISKSEQIRKQHISA